MHPYYTKPKPKPYQLVDVLPSTEELIEAENWINLLPDFVQRPALLKLIKWLAMKSNKLPVVIAVERKIGLD